MTLVGLHLFISLICTADLKDFLLCYYALFCGFKKCKDLSNSFVWVVRTEQYFVEGLGKDLCVFGLLLFP